MYDKRIVRRPAFGCINLFRRTGIQRIAAQSVNGLCRKSDQTARPDNTAGLPQQFFLYMLFIHLNDLGIHDVPRFLNVLSV